MNNIKYSVNKAIQCLMIILFTSIPATQLFYYAWPLTIFFGLLSFLSISIFHFLRHIYPPNIYIFAIINTIIFTILDALFWHYIPWYQDISHYTLITLAYNMFLYYTFTKHYGEYCIRHNLFSITIYSIGLLAIAIIREFFGYGHINVTAQTHILQISLIHRYPFLIMKITATGIIIFSIFMLIIRSLLASIRISGTTKQK